jgi:MFS family permease
MYKGNIKTIIGILLMGIVSMGAMSISAGLGNIAKAYPDVRIETIQTLITIPSLVIIVVSFLAGPISNIISKKILALIGLVIFAVGGCMPYFMSSFAVMYASRVIVGLGIGLLQPLGPAIVFERFASNAKMRDTLLGWINCSGSVGNIIMSVIGGVLVISSYKNIFLVHLLGLFALIGVLICLPQDRPSHEKKLDTHKEKTKPSSTAFYWFFVSFIYIPFLYCFVINLSLFVEGSKIGSAAVSGFGLSMFAIGGFVCGIIYGKLAEILKKWTLSVGFMISALGLFFMAIAKSPILVYVSGAFTGFGMLMVFPQIMTNIMDSVPPAAITFCIALNGAVICIGQSIAPYLVSGVSSIFAGNSIRGRFYVCAAILALIFTISAIRTMGRKNPVSVPQVGSRSDRL